MILSKYKHMLSSNYDVDNNLFRLYTPVQYNEHITTGNISSPYCREFLDSIVLDGDVGVIYVGGEAHHTSELRYTVETDSTPQKYVLSNMSYMVNKYVSVLSINNNISYVDIIATGWSSGVWALDKAQQLLDSGKCKHVVVIAEDKLQQSNIDMLKEYRLPTVLGEGYIICVFSKEGEGTEIKDIKTTYSYGVYSYPIFDSLKKVFTPADSIITYYNGFKDNIKEHYGKILSYTGLHGNTQGMSSLVDMLMFIEDTNEQGTGCVVSYGFGGFYGSFVVDKQ
jgi:hypothetical protein